MASTLRKAELVELAEEIGVTATGTKSVLLNSIRDHLAENPALAENPRYARFVRRPTSSSGSARARHNATVAKEEDADLDEDDQDEDQDEHDDDDEVDDSSDPNEFSQLAAQAKEAGEELLKVAEATEQSIVDSLQTFNEPINQGWNTVTESVQQWTEDLRAHFSTIFAVNALLIASEYALLLLDVRAEPTLRLPNFLYWHELKLIPGQNAVLTFVLDWIRAALPPFTLYTLVNLAAPLGVASVINFSDYPVDPLTFAVVRGLVAFIRGDTTVTLPVSVIQVVYALYGALRQ